MEYPFRSQRELGIVVPVAGLRSARSAGVGDFADLSGFAAYLGSNDVRVLQLLPVNDSGGQSSPYSSLTAFALHPIYAAIDKLPEWKLATKGIKTELEALQEPEAALGARTDRFDYDAVLKAKLDILRKLFLRRKTELSADGPCMDWIEANPWVPIYSVYRSIKQQHDELPWMQWPDRQQRLDAPTLAAIWKDGMEGKGDAPDAGFYAWLQWRLVAQLVDARATADSAGVVIKGDLPILINEDSADVWYHRDIFIPELRAGAPPDMFAPDGQNWQFPLYDWDVLSSQDYAWWRDRLRLADQFFGAYRIDHVLGFFRIWASPEEDIGGRRGRFVPAVRLSTSELNQVGLDEGRIRWLAEPHIPGDVLRDALGPEAEAVMQEVLHQLPGEDLWLFRPHITGERDIQGFEYSQLARDVLRAAFLDRALIATGPGEYAPGWFFRKTPRYAAMPDDVRHSFEQLLGSKEAESHQIWREQGRRLLGFMTQTVPMLACAEDLGVIPPVVPEVLGKLGVLGLRVCRWNRRFGEEGEPYIGLEDYEFATVTSPSVHDSSTLREWWERDEDPTAFAAMLGLSEVVKVETREYPAGTAVKALEALARVNSWLLVLLPQDLFDAVPELRSEDSRQDRINIPGTVTRFNWTWRMPVSLEHLEKNAEVGNLLVRLAGIRAAQELSERQAAALAAGSMAP